MPSSLDELIFTENTAEIMRVLRAIALRGHCDSEELEAMKLLAEPSCLFLRCFKDWQHRQVKVAALVALACVAADGDVVVRRWANQYAQDYLAHMRRGGYWLDPFGVLLLTAVDDPAALPTFRQLAELAPLWSLRIAGLYRLPESRANGVYTLIDKFREWIQCADFTAEPANSHHFWREWKLFMSCLTMDGLLDLLGKDNLRIEAPCSTLSPMIDWALDHGYAEWLVGELHWLTMSGGYARPVLKRMVQRAVPEAVEICLQEVKMSNFDDYAHFDVVRNILSLHPKPLPEAALEACWIVLRRPSHPALYQHRVDALNWLVEAASEGRYARSDVENLVLDLARNESDPDVRVAAIALVPWALSRHAREALADALAHESSKIREAALRVVAEANSGAR